MSVKRALSDRRLLALLLAALAALVALAVIAFADGWRTAGASAVLGAALLATRLRYARALALTALIAGAIVMLAGHGPASVDRSPVPPDALVHRRAAA